MVLSCKKCGSTSYVRAGNIRSCQRYQCRLCRCQFTDTKPRGVSPLLRNLGVILYAHHGVSMMGIAKLFKVSTVAVLKWIRKASDNIAASSNPYAHSAETIQVDEMWHFVNGKKTKFGSGERWMGYRVELSPGMWGIVLTQA